MRKALRFLASIKLAVIVIAGLAIVSAVGTIYESRYDAEVAKNLVYQSPYMYAVLGLLIVNLIAVIVSRYPWKKHHMSFILAHVGIILTLFGAWLTQRFGIDGSLVLEKGGQGNRFVSVPARKLAVFSSFDGGNYTTLADRTVNFLKNPPTPEKPFVIPIGADELKVTNYFHFANRKSEILPSERLADGPALRLGIESPFVNTSVWIRKDSRKEKEELKLGPATFVLGSEPNSETPQGNSAIFKALSDGSLSYEIFHEGKKSTSGTAREGDIVDTGWAGMKVRVIRFLPRSLERVEYEKADGPTGMTNSAIQVSYRGETHWLGLNTLLKLFFDQGVYIVSFANQRIDIGFKMRLEKFEIGRYQGTQRASSYQSDVDVEGLGVRKISMNEPLKYKGLTFYQASFEENDQGQPVASVLSVNYDPGRWVKYLGSFLIVLGSSALFYFKKRRVRKAKTAPIAFEAQKETA